MQYQLHLNLQQIAALRIAIYFWERKEVQDKITEFFKCSGKFKTYEIRYEWCKFTKTVVDEWNKELLPRNLDVELIHIIKMLSETIFDWFQYIKHEYGAEEEAINCVGRIHWTPYGTVDTIKIFKSFWLNNPNLDIIKLYHFACSNMLEEHIDDLWHKMPQDIQINGFPDVYARFNRHILVYWKCRRDNDLHNLPRYFEETASDFNRQYRKVFDLLYDSDRSLEENMLRLSVHQGYLVAVKYFWEKITKKERNESVFGCARIALMRYKFFQLKNQSIGDFKSRQYVEICIFLINQMSEVHKEVFFNESFSFTVSRTSYMEIDDVKDEILMMLLSAWPWQELFIPVLKDILQYLDDDNQMVCTFLDRITYKMIEDQTLGYSLEMSKYRWLLREAWLIVPGSFKRDILCSHSEVDFVDNLEKLWDVDSLKLIFNDPEIATVRDDFIYLGFNSYKELILNDQFDKLDDFIEEIYSSENEKKNFKKSISIWYELIEKQFHLADKYLEWGWSTPEEKKSTKKDIHAIRVCQNFIEKDKLDLVDKFLDWKFETKEEKKNCKDYFKSDKFSITTIYNIWRRYETNVEKAKEKSSQFLYWSLESEEEVRRFKNKKLVNMEIDKSTMGHLVNLNSIGNINDFLSWCSLDDKEVQQIKKAVSESKLKPDGLLLMQLRTIN